MSVKNFAEKFKIKAVNRLMSRDILFLRLRYNSVFLPAAITRAKIRTTAQIGRCPSARSKAPQARV